MSDESIEIFWRWILLFLKICVAIIAIRVILYLCGYHQHVPVLDQLAEPIMPFFQWLANGAKEVYGALYNFAYKLTH